MRANELLLSGGYEAHFGLREQPFALTPNPRYAFESRAHKAALEQLTLGLRRDGVTVVIGEVGTGKTLLCHVVAEQRESRVIVAILTKVPASGEEFLRHLLVEFGVLAADNHRMAAAGRLELFHALEQFLASLVPLDVRAVVLIDDAHRLTPEALEEIRLVSDLSVAGRRLLQVALIGQPELDTLLARADMRSLQQRVTQRHYLGPLEPEEVRSYIEWRMQVAAGDLKAEALFEPAAVRAAAALSRGVPRVINVLCERALEGAYARQSRTVEAETVRRAARDLQLSAAAGWRFAMAGRRAAVVAMAVVIGGAAGVAVWRSARAAFAPPQPAPASQAATLSPPPDAAPAPSPGPQPIPSPDVAAPKPAALPGVDSFSVVAGSFRTRGRAAAQATVLAQLGLPAFVRTTASGLEQAVAGPYESREEALAARERLIAAGQTDLEVVPRAVSTAGIGNRDVALLTQQGRTSVLLVAEGEAPGVRPVDAADPHVFAVEIGPSSSPAAPQTLVPSDGSLLVREVVVREKSRPGSGTFREVTVTANAPVTGTFRTEGRRVYLDLDPSPTSVVSPGLQPPLEAPPPPQAQAVTPSEVSGRGGDVSDRPGVLERAAALAAKPDVTALVRLRDQIAARADGAGADETAALLARVDALLDEARRRQLHADHEALVGEDGKKAR